MQQHICRTSSVAKAQADVKLLEGETQSLEMKHLSLKLQ